MMYPVARRLAFGVLVSLGTIACSSNNPTEPDIGFPVAGTASRAVGLAASDTFTFIAGRSGTVQVGMCGPTGVNLDLSGGNRTSATASNCEMIEFPVSQGASYRAVVSAPAGGGPYNICWRIGGDCTVTAPTVDETGAPAGYYASVEGKTGAEFFAALNDIIDNQRVLGYTSARDSLYAYVDDPDNDDVIIDIYVGRSAPGVNSRATAALADINTEHSWPQSRGANEDPAMSDLNILFSADETANGQRLNYPFGEIKGNVVWTSPAVAGSNEQSRLGYSGTGTSGQLVFEPRASKKGDIARAVLYFYVRYQPDPTPSFTLSNFNVERPILVKWAEADPPDDFERARNNLVYRAQGNRNPFIDRPDFAAQVLPGT